MTTFLLSPGPFCGQCGHPQQTNRAYRCQTCTCTTSHRFQTSAPSHRRPVQSGNGSTPAAPSDRNIGVGTARTLVWTLSAVAVGAALASFLTGTADGWSAIALATGAAGTWWHRTTERQRP